MHFVSETANLQNGTETRTHIDIKLYHKLQLLVKSGA